MVKCVQAGLLDNGLWERRHDKRGGKNCRDPKKRKSGHRISPCRLRGLRASDKQTVDAVLKFPITSFTLLLLPQGQAAGFLESSKGRDSGISFPGNTSGHRRECGNYRRIRSSDETSKASRPSSAAETLFRFSLFGCDCSKVRLQSGIPKRIEN